MQKTLVLLCLAVLGIVAIWTFPGNDEQTDNDVAIEPVPAVSEEAVSTDVAAPETTDTENTETIETTESSEPDPATDADIADAETTEASPFAVLPEPGSADTVDTRVANQSSTTAENTNAVAPAVSESSDINDGGAAGAEAAPGIVVPSSYPASEAAKYFVPADERRPGNLGGPPPPPGMGSTEGSAPDDGTLAPPAPPAQ